MSAHYQRLNGDQVVAILFLMKYTVGEMIHHFGPFLKCLAVYFSWAKFIKEGSADQPLI